MKFWKKKAKVIPQKEIFICPVHGEISGVPIVRFNFNGDIDRFCLFCIRDKCRELFPQVKSKLLEKNEKS